MLRIDSKKGNRIKKIHCSGKPVTFEVNIFETFHLIQIPV